jgi:hypothetical protein
VDGVCHPESKISATEHLRPLDPSWRSRRHGPAVAPPMAPPSVGPVLAAVTSGPPQRHGHDSGPGGQEIPCGVRLASTASFARSGSRFLNASCRGSCRSLQHLQLVPQGQHLELERGVRARRSSQGPGGARGARISSPSRVSVVGRNINRRNRNGLFSRHKRSDAPIFGRIEVKY